jgi:hypothetical protein
MGGVADYSLQVARALDEAGDTVHVWSPWAGEPIAVGGRMTVHRELEWNRPLSLRHIGAEIDA